MKNFLEPQVSIIGLKQRARHIAEHYACYIKAWRTIQTLLEYFSEDDQALTAIMRGFNTSLQNGGWMDLPDYAEVHNPVPQSRLNKN